MEEAEVEKGAGVDGGGGGRRGGVEEEVKVMLTHLAVEETVEDGHD